MLSNHLLDQASDSFPGVVVGLGRVGVSRFVVLGGHVVPAPVPVIVRCRFLFTALLRNLDDVIVVVVAVGKLLVGHVRLEHDLVDPGFGDPPIGGRPPPPPIVRLQSRQVHQTDVVVRVVHGGVHVAVDVVDREDGVRLPRRPGVVVVEQPPTVRAVGLAAANYSAQSDNLVRQFAPDGEIAAPLVVAVVTVITARVLGGLFCKNYSNQGVVVDGVDTPLSGLFWMFFWRSSSRQVHSLYGSR
jgi:hypothetical protein